MRLRRHPAAAIAALLALSAAAADQPFLQVDSQIDVLRYEVELKVRELRDEPVEATVVVDFQAVRNNINSIRLNIEPAKIAVQSIRDSSGAALHYAIESGESNPYGLSGSVLVISLSRVLSAGHAMRVEIKYSADVQPATEQRGLFFTSNHHGAPILTTRSWPYYARYWLPSNDHPSDGAEFQFAITVPVDTIAAANGALIATTHTIDGTQYVWEQREPIPTYAAQVTIGALHSRESTFCFDLSAGMRTVCGTDSAELPLLFLHPPELPNRAAYESEIDRAMNALAYFSTAFGRYGFAKAGFVAAPHPFSMESASLITLIRPEHAVHEVIHHWWGNSVRIASWGDLWISEGLTTYFTGFFDEISTGVNTACTRHEKINVARDVDPLTQFHPSCTGAAAVHDFRQWLARELGTDIRNPAAIAAFLDVFERVYADATFKPIDTHGLRRLLTSAAVHVLESSGSRTTHDEVDAALRRWAETWFLNLPTETPARRRAVSR